MRRRTPLIALLLAPIALWAVVMAWNRVLLPLSVKMWRSEPAVQARLAVGDPEMRAKAMSEAASAGVRPPSVIIWTLSNRRIKVSRAFF